MEAFKKAQGSRRCEKASGRIGANGDLESGGGLVKVILSGNQEPCRNFPDVLGEGAEVLSDLVTAAMKDAYNKSTFTMREHGRTDEWAGASRNVKSVRGQSGVRRAEGLFTPAPSAPQLSSLTLNASLLNGGDLRTQLAP